MTDPSHVSISTQTPASPARIRVVRLTLAALSMADLTDGLRIAMYLADSSPLQSACALGVALRESSDLTEQLGVA